MKKLITFAVVVSFSFSATAQKEGFSKGDNFFSGSLGYNSSNDKNLDERTSSFSIAPNVARFVTEHLAVGIGIGYKIDITNTARIETENISTFSAGVFANYFFTPSNRFSFCGSIGAAYASANDKISKIRGNAFVGSLSPGINYFLTKNVSIQSFVGSLTYLTAGSDEAGDNGFTGFALNLDLTKVNFGMAVKF